MTFSSIKDRIEALPEPERSARRMLYSPYEWESSWALNAWDHQRPPIEMDWIVWTVIGPPRTGSTTAGLRWMEEKFLYTPAKHLLVMVRYRGQIDEVANHFHRVMGTLGANSAFKYRETATRASFRGDTKSLEILVERKNYDMELRGADFDYVWANDIEDARMLMRTLPRVKQFVFTDPTKLPEQTLLSRARA